MLAYQPVMKRNCNNSASHFRSSFIWGGLLFCLTCGLLPLASYSQTIQKKPQDNQIVDEFNKRVQQYVKLRKQIDTKLTKPSGKSEPEQIKAYQTALEEGLRNARAEAKHEDLFTPVMAAHIRRVIKREFKGSRLRKLRKDVAEANTKGVALRINYPYPEQKELDEMPPTLLLKLPALPKQLRYRFVGENMLLVDSEALLIVDYMTNAIP